MTGRAMPGLLSTTCEPVVRSRVKPSASKTRTSVRQSVGASRLMRHERERDVNHVPDFRRLRHYRLRLESAVLQHSIGAMS